MKRVLAVLLALTMVVGLGVAVMADTSTPSITVVPNNTEADTESLAINYTYYQILEASIDTDPAVTQDTGVTATAGTVAYFVTTQDRAAQLTNTNLFNVTKVDGQNKWYVEAKNKETITAQAIIEAIEASTFDLSQFPTGTFDKTSAETQAESGTLSAGYYYITSSLGTKAAVETLTAVTINEKNNYPSNTKTDDKEYAAIDDTVTYTVTVTIPESVASKPITIVDTITDGLTLNTSVTVSGGVADPAYTSATFTAGAHTDATAAVADDLSTADVDESRPAAQGTTVYTLEIPAATVLANKGKTLTFAYTAKVNEKAVVLEKEHNKAHITYDHFTTVDVDTDVTTLAFDAQKVDGTDKTTVLAGAEFKLYDTLTGGNEIKVVLKEAASDTNGQVSTYRVAKEGETGVAMAGGTFRVEGLDSKTYYLEETKAPTGYNQLTARVEAAASTTTAPDSNIDYKVENNKGATLPSTGGIGTTIFYVVGGLLAVGAGVVLVTKKRMGKEEN